MHVVIKPTDYDVQLNGGRKHEFPEELVLRQYRVEGLAGEYFYYGIGVPRHIWEK